MLARKINPLALFLCVAVVLVLGYAILAMTDRRPAEVGRGETLHTRSFDGPAMPREMSLPAEPGSAGRAIAGPSVSPAAAPGVAFNYRYAFRLPAERISQVQERHAEACERLGMHRCRITGLRYRVADASHIEAMLAVKLDPSLARRFGRAAVEAVANADGTLVESEIGGAEADVGAAVRSIAEMTGELNRIEGRLARGGQSASDRQALEYEAQQLRRALRAQRANREEQQEALASTAMVFLYGATRVSAGRDGEMSVQDATSRAWGNFLGGLTILFIIIVTLLPWLVAALLVWGLAHVIRRWIRRSALDDSGQRPGAMELTPQPAE